MLTPQVQLGPYRIIAPIGAGGMGEVYRATDTRLGRDVAIKVLPASFGSDPDRLRRFEQEARATGLLNHPNILSIFDVGQHESSPFLVSELLEGETLRERLEGGRVSVKRAIDYAQQLANGLAAAHEKGVVHRDLKPENIFLTKDGRLKILDFGLARVTTQMASDGADADAPTAPIGTDPGAVLGTVGYMSPEQVRGKPADVRSDIFAFGTVLFEMISGRRAFRRDSAVETMNAILKDDPPELSAVDGVPPALDRIVVHCLEKQPEARFQSARDISFSLSTLSDLSASQSATILTSRAKRRWLVPAMIAGALILITATFFAARRFGQTDPPSYKRLTFDQADIYWAAFSPTDGSIFYGTYAGKAGEIFSVQATATDARRVGFGAHGALGISRKGELALQLHPKFVRPFTFSGTLATVPAAGGTPREIAENVLWAAWSQTRDDLLVVRMRTGGAADQIEYPIGTVLYESKGWIDYPSFSRDGSKIAFLEHPRLGSDSGGVAMIDLAGKYRLLTGASSTIRGLAWSSDSKEIWFTAATIGGTRALYAVKPGEEARLVERVPSSLVLADIDAKGRVLLVQTAERMGTIVRTPDSAEREYSWLDWTLARDIASDGSAILFDETGEAGSDSGIVYLRATDGAPAVRLAEGTARSLSPDGKSVLVRTQDERLILVPTKAGQPRPLPGKGYLGGLLLPDGRRLIVGVTDEKSGAQHFVMNLDGTGKRAISPTGMVPTRPHLSPDGKWIAAIEARERRTILLPVEGGAPRAVPSLTAGDRVLGWSADGGHLYLARPSAPTDIMRVNLATGRIDPWVTIGTALPPSATFNSVIIAPDGRSYVYTYRESKSTLYLAEGLR